LLPRAVTLEICERHGLDRIAQESVWGQVVRRLQENGDYHYLVQEQKVAWHAPRAAFVRDHALPVQPCTVTGTSRVAVVEPLEAQAQESNRSAQQKRALTTIGATMTANVGRKLTELAAHQLVTATGDLVTDADYQKRATESQNELLRAQLKEVRGQLASAMAILKAVTGAENALVKDNDQPAASLRRN